MFLFFKKINEPKCKGNFEEVRDNEIPIKMESVDGIGKKDSKGILVARADPKNNYRIEVPIFTNTNIFTEKKEKKKK